MRHARLVNKTEKEIDALYDEMREVAGKLHVPTMEAVIAVSLIKPNDQEVKQFRRHSRSFTRNMYSLHSWRMAIYTEDNAWGDGYLCMRNTGGTIVGRSGRPPYIHANNMQTGSYGFRAGGFEAGTDNTAESIDDYQLGAEIADGTGAGELSRATTAFQSKGWNAGSSYYYSIFDRLLTNGSGAEITAYEFSCQWRSRTNSHYLMMSRDVEAGGVAIPNGDILKISYEHRISYP